MNKILKSFILSVIMFSCFIFSSCSEDEPVIIQTGSNPPAETIYGAFILCQGADVYPQERYIGFYNIDKDSFIYNIYKPGLLPAVPRSMVYSEGSLYITSSSFFNNIPSRITKISAWGSTQGELIIDQQKPNNPNIVYKYNKSFLLTYFLTNGLDQGNLEIFENDPMGQVNNYTNIKGYISSVYTGINKVFLTTSNQQGFYPDSTLIMLIPPDTNTVRTRLSGAPCGINFINGNRLLIGCKGQNSKIYYINPDNLAITDSVNCSNGFEKDLRNDKNNIYSYFISTDDKIIKFDPVQKTFSVFINNSFSGDNFIISGYNIDPNTGKHFVLYSSRGDYYGGKLQVYSRSGFLENTVATGKKPVQVVFAGN